MHMFVSVHIDTVASCILVYVVVYMCVSVHIRIHSVHISQKYSHAPEHTHCLRISHSCSPTTGTKGRCHTRNRPMRVEPPFMCVVCVTCMHGLRCGSVRQQGVWCCSVCVFAHVACMHIICTCTFTCSFVYPPYIPMHIVHMDFDIWSKR